MAQTKGNHLSIQDTNNTAQRIHTHYLAVIFTRSREGGLKKTSQQYWCWLSMILIM